MSFLSPSSDYTFSNMEEDYIEPNQPNSDNELEDSLIRVSGMYKDWFLDYASYVILERAVPSIRH